MICANYANETFNWLLNVLDVLLNFLLLLYKTLKPDTDLFTHMNGLNLTLSLHNKLDFKQVTLRMHTNSQLFLFIVCVLLTSAQDCFHPRTFFFFTTAS